LINLDNILSLTAFSALSGLATLVGVVASSDVTDEPKPLPYAINSIRPVGPDEKRGDQNWSAFARRAEFATGPASGRPRWEPAALAPTVCIFAIQLMLGCNLIAATLYLSRNSERMASMAVILRHLFVPSSD
jgi:hypothetical protein